MAKLARLDLTIGSLLLLVILFVPRTLSAQQYDGQILPTDLQTYHEGISPLFAGCELSSCYPCDNPRRLNWVINFTANELVDSVTLVFDEIRQGQFNALIVTGNGYKQETGSRKEIRIGPGATIISKVRNKLLLRDRDILISAIPELIFKMPYEPDDYTDYSPITFTLTQTCAESGETYEVNDYGFNYAFEQKTYRNTMEPLSAAERENLINLFEENSIIQNELMELELLNFSPQGGPFVFCVAGTDGDVPVVFLDGKQTDCENDLKYDTPFDEVDIAGDPRLYLFQIPYTDNDPACSSEIYVFAEEHPPVLMNLPSGFQSDKAVNLGGKYNIELAVWYEPDLVDATAQPDMDNEFLMENASSFNDARAMYAINRTGISLPTSTNISNIKPLPERTQTFPQDELPSIYQYISDAFNIGAGFFDGKLRTTNTNNIQTFSHNSIPYYDPNRLNIYFINRGETGQFVAPNIILLGTNATTRLLGHEIAHALGLHDLNPSCGLDADGDGTNESSTILNIMNNSISAPPIILEGQAFRMNLSPNSYLNLNQHGNQIRNGPIRGCSDFCSDFLYVFDHNCPIITLKKN